MRKERMDSTVQLGSLERHGNFLASASSGGCLGSRTGIHLSLVLPDAKGRSCACPQNSHQHPPGVGATCQVCLPVGPTPLRWRCISAEQQDSTAAADMQHSATVRAKSPGAPRFRCKNEQMWDGWHPLQRRQSGLVENLRDILGAPHQIA